ncbi:hypothetical protein AYO37_00190 [Opitutia bacterium SCGC AG-212-L18]|nr:hypothetical protein AYO37_00190 [Opitutae bacterium SCGC AG-212-L18]
MNPGDTWFRGTHANAAKVPGQIAEKLRGQQFRSWDHFRESFWKEVANDPVLSKNFKIDDVLLMKNKGTAPRASETQWENSIRGYQIHHKNPIHNGGNVYDMDNLLIVTPRYHREILSPNFHYNRK